MAKDKDVYVPWDKQERAKNLMRTDWPKNSLQFQLKQRIEKKKGGKA